MLSIGSTGATDRWICGAELSSIVGAAAPLAGPQLVDHPVLRHLEQPGRELAAVVKAG